ncbi:MAG: hypothetical protein P4L75_07325 [Clostridia bacterium]|nr:hypothetical protein [Clostridia bacterium]
MKKLVPILAIAIIFVAAISGCGLNDSQKGSSASTAQTGSGVNTAGSGAGASIQSPTGKVAGIDSDAQAIEQMLGQIASDASQVTVDGSQSEAMDSLTSQLNKMLDSGSDNISSLN